MGILGILHFLNNLLQESLIVTSAIHLLIFGWIINTLVMSVSSPPPKKESNTVIYHETETYKEYQFLSTVFMNMTTLNVKHAKPRAG